MKRALILNDGRIGHLNQSIAFCKLKNIQYIIIDLCCIGRIAKALTYLFDKFNIYTSMLLNRDILIKERDSFDVVVSTGSSTYYANSVLSKKYNLKSVVLMYPNGYKLSNFDYIIAQKHDNPPKIKNLIEIPINLSQPKVINSFKPSTKAISIVIGGDNRYFQMKREPIKETLDFIFEKFPHMPKAITTSRRTSKEIEELVNRYDFDYKVIYSENPINPIGDFLVNSEYVFITSDSTSMISEAVSFGNACVEIIKLDTKKSSKFSRLIDGLSMENSLHIFNGEIGQASNKININSYLSEVSL
jgi:hypothetical protein